MYTPNCINNHIKYKWSKYPVKRQKLLDPNKCWLWETNFKYNSTHRLNWKGWKKTYQDKTKERKAGVTTTENTTTILLSNKVDFRASKY